VTVPWRKGISDIGSILNRTFKIDIKKIGFPKVNFPNGLNP